jgi:SAM-dependent methyltransferase
VTFARYPLQRDEAEHQRLDAQARFWSPDAAAMFESAGVAPGCKVADIGCGTLDVALLQARRVRTCGSVHGLDNDGLLVRRMGRLAPSIPTAKVRVTEGDAYATGWQSGVLDAVHARFLAAPAGRLDGLVAEMQRVVRPGGTLMLQEPASSTWKLPGAGGAWVRLLALIRKGFAIRGGDFDAGRHCAATFERGGIDDVQSRYVARTIDCRDPYASLPLAFARQLRPLWLAERLATAAELDELVREVAAALARGGQATTFTLVQTWGRAPWRNR